MKIYRELLTGICRVLFMVRWGLYMYMYMYICVYSRLYWHSRRDILGLVAVGFCFGLYARTCLAP